MKYAAVDMGTNSCRLLIADIDENDNLIPLKRNLITTRIGEGLSLTGKISCQAVRRTIECLSEFALDIELHDVTAARAVATSAVREADNQEIFIKDMLEYFPGPIDIIDGDEEALLTYQGVKKGLKLKHCPVVVDPGGGSTEFILDDGNIYIRSLPLGAVRSTESDMSLEDMAKILNEGISDKNILIGYPVVFVGGTATSMVSMKLKMKQYIPELIHGQVLTKKEIDEICDILSKTDLEERKVMPGLQPERADIIPQGARIISLIMELLEADEMTVSESDLLEGIIWNLHQAYNN